MIDQSETSLSSIIGVSPKYFENWESGNSKASELGGPHTADQSISEIIKSHSSRAPEATNTIKTIAEVFVLAVKPLISNQVGNLTGEEKDREAFILYREAETGLLHSLQGFLDSRGEKGTVMAENFPNQPYGE